MSRTSRTSRTECKRCFLLVSIRRNYIYFSFIFYRRNNIYYLQKKFMHTKNQSDLKTNFL